MNIRHGHEDVIAMALETESASVESAPFEAFAALHKGEMAPDWIDAALGQWDFEAGSAGTAVGTPHAQLITVSENATFLVHRETGTPVAVMRVHRPGYVDDPTVIESELRWIDALKDAITIPVPEPIRKADGSFVATFPGPDGATWFAVAFRFVEGEILEDAADPTPYYVEIGRITAQFQNQSEQWVRPDGFVRHKWTLPDMVGELARWGDWRNVDLTDDDRAAMEQAEAAALAVLQPWHPGDGEWGLIHADLRPSNIMTDGESLTVIDFDDCGDSYYLYDFASHRTRIVRA